MSYDKNRQRNIKKFSLSCAIRSLNVIDVLLIISFTGIFLLHLKYTLWESIAQILYIKIIFKNIKT